MNIKPKTLGSMYHLLGESVINKDINNVKQTVKQKKIMEDHKVKCLKMY